MRTALLRKEALIIVFVALLTLIDAMRADGFDPALKYSLINWDWAELVLAEQIIITT